MTKKGKIFEQLATAFPLKPIRDDKHLEAALVAVHKVNLFMEKNPAHTDECLGYLHDLEELISDYKEAQGVH